MVDAGQKRWQRIQVASGMMCVCDPFFSRPRCPEETPPEPTLDRSFMAVRSGGGLGSLRISAIRLEDGTASDVLSPFGCRLEASIRDLFPSEEPLSSGKGELRLFVRFGLGPAPGGLRGRAGRLDSRVCLSCPCIPGEGVVGGEEEFDLGGDMGRH